MLYVCGEAEDFFGIGIAAHEADASDLSAIACQESVKQVGGKRFANIFPEMLGVASRAMTRTPGEVERKRHLSGDLLENDIVGCDLQFTIQNSQFTIQNS